MSASARMLSDFPMGVGANNFGLANNSLGYAEEAEIAWTSRAAIVHNIYWLALAETGYLGFLALVILLIRPLFVALRCGWRNRRDERGDLLIGFGTSLLIIYIHSYFEWVLFYYSGPIYLRNDHRYGSRRGPAIGLLANCEGRRFRAPCGARPRRSANLTFIS